jgi:hypothetical protein
MYVCMYVCMYDKLIHIRETSCVLCKLEKLGFRLWFKKHLSEKLIKIGFKFHFLQANFHDWQCCVEHMCKF